MSADRFARFMSDAAQAYDLFQPSNVSSEITFPKSAYFSLK